MNRHFAIPTLIAIVGLSFAAAGANAQNRHPRVHEVNHRLGNQHNRVHQGVKSGELTHRETANIRKTDAKIHQEIHQDRLAHNGHLTKAETRHINKELNHESRVIHRDKHNNRVR